MKAPGNDCLNYQIRQKNIYVYIYIRGSHIKHTFSNNFRHLVFINLPFTLLFDLQQDIFYICIYNIYLHTY